MSGSRREREAQPSSETVHHIVKAEVSALDTKMGALQADVGTLKAEVGTLKAEISSVNDKLDKILLSITRA